MLLTFIVCIWLSIWPPLLQTAYNIIQREVVSDILPGIIMNTQDIGFVLNLWQLNRELVIWGLLDAQNLGPDSLLRIIEICHELKVNTGKNYVNFCLNPINILEGSSSSYAIESISSSIYLLKLFLNFIFDQLLYVYQLIMWRFIISDSSLCYRVSSTVIWHQVGNTCLTERVCGD